MTPQSDLRSSDGGAAIVNAIHEPALDVIPQKGAILLRKYDAKAGCVRNAKRYLAMRFATGSHFGRRLALSMSECPARKELSDFRRL